LATEELILKVNDFNSKIIDEIDEYEKELLEFNKTNSLSFNLYNYYLIVDSNQKIAEAILFN